MNEIEQALKINTGLARSILMNFIEIELKRAGFQQAVIGISGGVDSALSCFLAAGLPSRWWKCWWW